MGNLQGIFGLTEESFELSYNKSIEQEKICKNIVETSMTRVEKYTLTTDMNKKIITKKMSSKTINLWPKRTRH